METKEVLIEKKEVGNAMKALVKVVSANGQEKYCIRRYYRGTLMKSTKYDFQIDATDSFKST